MTLFCYVVSGTWKVVITCHHACQNDCYTTHHSNTNTNKDTNTNQWKDMYTSLLTSAFRSTDLLSPSNAICSADHNWILKFWYSGFLKKFKILFAVAIPIADRCWQVWIVQLRPRQIMICYCCAFECLISWYWIAPSVFTPVSPPEHQGWPRKLEKMKKANKSPTLKTAVTMSSDWHLDHLKARKK